jgi:hypothetical protein
VFDEFADGGEVAGDDGECEGHGLHEHDGDSVTVARRVGPAGEDEEMGGAHQVRDGVRGDGAEEADGEVGSLAGEGLEAREFGAVTGDGEGEAWSDGGGELCGSDEEVDAFLGHEAGEREEMEAGGDGLWWVRRDGDTAADEGEARGGDASEVGVKPAVFVGDAGGEGGAFELSAQEGPACEEVVGVAGEGEGEAEVVGGVHGDGGGRVGEVSAEEVGVGSACDRGEGDGGQRLGEEFETDAERGGLSGEEDVGGDTREGADGAEGVEDGLDQEAKGKAGVVERVVGARG